jgi:hypothetical protein
MQVLHRLRKTYKLLTTPFPLLRKEGIKVLGAFCPGKGRPSSAYGEPAAFNSPMAFRRSRHHTERTEKVRNPI